MGSLWGSKKDGEDHEDRDEEGQEEPRATSSHSQPSRRSEDTNERTRLLPRQDQSAGYLSPDDPAVSFLCVCGIYQLLMLSIGVSIQPVERASVAMVRSSIPYDHLPVVGTTLCIPIRQSSEDALKRIRIF
jgi:hypothetical protein